MSEKKILIVDPDQKASDRIAASGRNFNFKVGVVTKGKGLVQALSESAPHLMVLNIELPDVDGLELYKEIRTHKDLKKLPIILTAKPENKAKFTKHKKLKTAAEGYLIKPIQSEDLIDLLETIIGLPPPPSSRKDFVKRLEYENVQSDLQSKAKELEDLEMKLKKALKQVSDYEDQLQNFQGDKNQALAEQQREAEDRNLTFQREKDEWSEKTQDLQYQLDQLLGEKEEFRKQIEESQRRLDLAQKENTKREEDLKRRINELLLQVDDAHREKDKLKTQMEDLIKTHQEEIEKIRGDFNALDEDKVRMEQRVVKAYKKIKTDQVKDEKIQKALEIALQLLKNQ